MADSRQRAESKTLQGRAMCVRVLYPLFTATSCFFCHSIYMSRVIVLLLPRSPYVPHLTPHVLLVASWRSLIISWSSNCDALLEIIHIIRCKIFVCVLSSGAVCIFSRTDRSWARLYRVYPKGAIKVLLLLSTTNKYFFVRVKCEFITFPGKFFLYVLLQTKMVIASGSENNVSLRHSPRHLLPGGEPCIYYGYSGGYP